MRLFAALALVYVALSVLANWLASRYLVTVPLTTYVAPAGVFCIGAILVLRDWMQQLAAAFPHRDGLGPRPTGLAWTLALVPVAGAISYLAAELAGWVALERIAFASVIAFCLSETVEALVFTPLRRRNLTVGVALSATVGNALDSYVFLWIAFGSQAFFAGNFVGKGEAIAVGVALTLGRRLVVPVRAATA